MRALLFLSLLGTLVGAPLAAANLPAALEAKAKEAFAEIAKAKAALDAGHTATSQSLLSQAETALKSILTQAPGSKVLNNVDQASSAAEQGDAQQSQSALSQAQQEAGKLDPSLASKVDAAKGPAAQGDTSNLGAVRQETAQKTGLDKIESAYQKVSLARSLLSAGNTSKAKGLLDEIVSSPSGVLPH